MTDTPDKLPRWSDLLGAIPPTPGPAPDVTTAEVRERYMDGIRAAVWGLGSHTMDDYAAAFDRWLAARDAGIKATALREAHAAIQAELDSDSLMARALRRECNQNAHDAVGWVQSVLQERADELGQP